MRFLVSRTATFRDWEAWGENVDVVDEVSSVHVRSNGLPAWLRPVTTKWLQLRLALRLLSLSRRYDAIMVGRYGLLLPVFQRWLGMRRRVVMTDVEWPGWGTGIMNRIAGGAASVLCCFTRIEMDRYSAHFGVPRAKFRFVPLAFQWSDIEPCTPSDGGYIFTGGNQARDWKTLLRAVEGLPYQVRLLARAVAPASAPRNVTVACASRPGFNAQMAAASCVVVPILREPLRIAGITTWANAMALGKVVIVTDPDGAPDYMENGVSGFYVNHGDVRALRECIVKVMEDAGLRKRIGDAARERAWNQFSPEVFRGRILALLREVSR